MVRWSIFLNVILLFVVNFIYLIAELSILFNRSINSFIEQSFRSNFNRTNLTKKTFFRNDFFEHIDLNLEKFNSCVSFNKVNRVILVPESIEPDDLRSLTKDLK